MIPYRILYVGPKGKKFESIRALFENRFEYVFVNQTDATERISDPSKYAGIVIETEINSNPDESRKLAEELERISSQKGHSLITILI